VTPRPADFLVNRVLHRDGVVIVIDKPAGMVVHPKPGSKGESLEDYFDALRFGVRHKPALAHRLDRDTTGCLVLGRHPKALRKLHRIFADGLAGKTYWAICRGVPAAASGVIDAPLRKLNEPSGWRMAIDEEGLTARTDWRLLSTAGGLSFIEALPKTGRTHQIRVHLASIGCPIVGDPLYGELSAEDRREAMMLHARAISLPISRTGPPVTVEAAPPPPFLAYLSRSGLALP
jgi:RluA family pseudouridine synthase